MRDFEETRLTSDEERTLQYRYIEKAKELVKKQRKKYITTSIIKKNGLC